MLRAKIIGVGAALGNIIRDNHYFASRLDTSDEWIRQRTGIDTRFIVDESQDLASLCTQALTDSAVDVSDLGAIIVATTTADNAFPSCAAKVHGIIGAPASCLAFDVNAACCGFIYALYLAANLLPAHKKIAVIGADIMSRLVDPEDRNTAILFGDGAGCVIMEHTHDDIGFLGFDICTDGGSFDALYTEPCVKMDGKRVFTAAVRLMSESLANCCAKSQIAVTDLDFVIPHQANIRIIDSMQRQLGLRDERMIKTVQCHSNTSAASIPLAWNMNKQHIRGLTGLCAIGAGLTWGSCVIKLA